ncbi:hypothetical protein SAMN05660462_02917 [Proteiniborus ethanoligenes]|uniref:Uncharacterized protein n=1 Tax=Proteiniborus ethanoligenes TaxID=415015 RepID=A0A1H3SIA3_9FIRM|nr:hypothetical protein [Proteiniborus ethanoligenes]SDZ37457.1 hypothetical protein SAMN05660462_02917 [Proteiniborus ethanoligenes]
MNDMDNVEKLLCELSISFITLFDMLKKKGIISQKEYISHTSFKKEFLQNTRYNNN